MRYLFKYQILTRSTAMRERERERSKDIKYCRPLYILYSNIFLRDELYYSIANLYLSFETSDVILLTPDDVI